LLSSSIGDIEQAAISTLSICSMKNSAVSAHSKAAENLRDYRFTTIYSIEGEVSYDNTFVEFYPDEAALARQVIQLFFEKMS
jgi:hypothetical protein